MYRRPALVALVLSGGVLLAVIGEYVAPPYAYAQMPIGALAQVKNSNLLLAANPPPTKPPTVNLGPIQQAIVALQMEADTDHNEIATLKSQLTVDEKTIASLESKVAALQTTSSAQQGSLQKLQAQFANHYHTFTVTSPGRTTSALITFHCPGIGQPCTANASIPSANNDYGMIIYPSTSTTFPASTSTVSTSGPKTN